MMKMCIWSRLFIFRVYLQFSLIFAILMRQFNYLISALKDADEIAVGGSFCVDVKAIVEVDIQLDFVRGALLSFFYAD